MNGTESDEKIAVRSKSSEENEEIKIAVNENLVISSESTLKMIPTLPPPPSEENIGIQNQDSISLELPQDQPAQSSFLPGDER